METVSFKASEKHVNKIDEIVEEKCYTSKGGYLRELLRNDADPKLTAETIKSIEQSHKQISEGNKLCQRKRFFEASSSTCSNDL